MKHPNLLLTIALQLSVFQAFSGPGIINSGGRIVSSGTGSYWVVSGGNFNLTSRSVDNLASMNNLTIASGASLTIDSQSFLTVTGAVTNSNSTGTVGLTVNSDATGTASLITPSATGTGAAAAQRYMSAGAWHLVSAPVVQTVSGFLTANANIPTNSSSYRGMMDYNPASNNWNAFFTDGSGNGSLGAGKGFCERVGASAAVTATGLLQAGAKGVAASAGYWDCIGNPYTSAIGITSASTATDKFLAVNTDNFEPSYAAIYVWAKGDSFNGYNGNYTPVSNVPTTGFDDLPQGQAFMVKRKTTGGADFSFTTAMQLHSGALELKSAQTPWPIIKLVASANSQTGSTLIAFNDGMTKGLDVTYDAGLLRGGSDVQVYTKLVEASGNTTPFAIQALPDNNFNSMIIPVGVESRIGGDVVFSAETTNLPSNCKVILEDKLTKTFTDLSANTYKAAILPNSTVADRFQLHTSAATIGATGQNILSGKLNAYAIGNTEIRVVGEVSGKAVATLYDVLGRAVAIQKLNEGNLNVIPLTNIKPGVYILSVEDKGTTNFKIRIVN
ncbi:MAG: T9SS type A sorting domain-containing protein [Mariniphaga sp.]